VDSSHRVRPGDVVSLKVPLAKLQLFATDEEGTSLVRTAEAVA
jgi:hypothetical protein